MPVCPTCDKNFDIIHGHYKKFCCGQCKSTYHNRTKRGLPLKNYESPYHGTPEQRFWIRVNKNGPIPEHCKEIGMCWVWTGRKDGAYGTIIINGKEKKCSRFSYELHNGAIPSGYEICHKCDNPLCVNPKHLWAGTHQENMRDCWKKGRFTSLINFSVLHGTNLGLLTTEQIDTIISYCIQEKYKRLESHDVL